MNRLTMDRIGTMNDGLGLIINALELRLPRNQGFLCRNEAIQAGMGRNETEIALISNDLPTCHAFADLPACHAFAGLPACHALTDGGPTLDGS